jgi:hypothetical protein
MVRYHARRRVPWWAIALVALACAGLLYLVMTSGGDDASESPSARSGGAAVEGSDPQGGHSEEPDASVVAGFAQPAVGERLQLRVISLGDDPNRCRAASLRVSGEVKTAYHHRCEGRDAELAFFLVRLTGLAEEPVTVRLDGFELVTRGGRALEPVELDDVNKRFPEETALGRDVGRKGWVVFELSGVPASVRYADGDQVLAVRFPGTWL